MEQSINASIQYNQNQYNNQSIHLTAVQHNNIYKNDSCSGIHERMVQCCVSMRETVTQFWATLHKNSCLVSIRHSDTCDQGLSSHTVQMRKIQCLHVLVGMRWWRWIKCHLRLTRGPAIKSPNIDTQWCVKYTKGSCQAFCIGYQTISFMVSVGWDHHWVAMECSQKINALQKCHNSPCDTNIPSDTPCDNIHTQNACSNVAHILRTQTEHRDDAAPKSIVLALL